MKGGARRWKLSRATATSASSAESSRSCDPAPSPASGTVPENPAFDSRNLTAGRSSTHAVTPRTRRGVVTLIVISGRDDVEDTPVTYQRRTPLISYAESSARGATG